MMKGFLGTFAICLITCVVGVFFLAELLLSNIWADVVLAALFLSVLITVFMNQDSRIEELEKKIRQLQKEEEPPSGQ